MEHFFQGLVVGFAYVAPIGVQNLFVINAALKLARPRAFLTALTVIFFDVTLALACFWWVGALMQEWVWLQKLMLLAGSLAVLYMGFGLLRAGDVADVRRETPPSWRRTAVFACVVTWFNPQALIDGTMMLGAFHVTLAEKGAVPFISGVATASVLWFLSLTAVVSAFRAGFHPKVLRAVNRVSGVIMLYYGGRLFLAFLALYPDILHLLP